MLNRELLENQLAEFPLFAYGFLDPQTLDFTERVRYICSTECPMHGKTWACPPAVGSVGECREKCLAFKDCLMIATITEVSDIANVEEALEEADFVLKRIKGYDITMPVVFDWEYVSAEARTANMDDRTLPDLNLIYCERMEKEGYQPMIYFNSTQARTLLFLYELEEYPFWLAYYSDRMNYPYRFEMWQYSCTGRVPGIEGDVDLNILLLDQKLRPQ